MSFMRVEKNETGLFFDAFKHIKNNFSNIIFHEILEFQKIGVSGYIALKPTNYKSKIPDMKKMGLIDYDSPHDAKLTEVGESIINYVKETTELHVKRYGSFRIDSIGKDLFQCEYYSSDEFQKIADLLLKVELNYYDSATSLRPYFVLIKIIIKNNIKKLNDETLLNILSLDKASALNLKYDENSFENITNDEVKKQIKRPKSYIYDFLKTSKIINNNKDITLDLEKISATISEMSEINYDDSNKDPIKTAGRIGQQMFRKEVLKAYNYKCALTSKNVSYISKKTGYSSYVLDAAHIIPYADGGSFSVKNGLSLSPEIHEYYDIGIITFEFNAKNELICKVSKSAKVNAKDLLRFDNQKLNLPENSAHIPDMQALNYKKQITFIV